MAAVAPVPAAAATHAFQAEARDHAETPLVAYEDIAPLLRLLDPELIYDPYYCEGTMRKHLATLGFARVHNVNEDFYAVAAAGQCPAYSVLVTNPPFSGDHLERIVSFAAASGRPWLLLMPQYVARKGFYLEAVKRMVVKPFYVGPVEEAYVFAAPARPEVQAARASDAATATAMPVGAGAFQCVWFVHLGDASRQAAGLAAIEGAGGSAVAAENAADLPQLMAAPPLTPAERRWRKKRKRESESGVDEATATVRVLHGRSAKVDRASDRGAPRGKPERKRARRS